MVDNTTNTGIPGERSANWAETANFYLSHDVAFQWFFHFNGADAARRLDNYNAHKDFFRGSGATVPEIQRFDDAYIIADISNDHTVKEGILSQYVAGKTPDQLLDGFIAADPSRRELFEVIRADEGLKGAVHSAISQDPTVFYAFSGMTGENSYLNLDRLTAELADPAKRAAFATSLRQVGESAALTGSDLVATMSSNDVEVGVRADIAEGAQRRFLGSITGTNLVELPGLGLVPLGFAGGEWNSIAGMPEGAERDRAVADLIATKTPEQLLNALEAASPESKGVIDILRTDTTLATALRDAAGQDPTVINGLSKLIGPGSGLDPEGLTRALADPQTRSGLLTMLEKTGHEEDLTFDDLAEAIQSGVMFSKDAKNPAAAERYRSALARFGLQDNRIMMAQLMADPMAALQQMIQDPHTFFANIRAALGNIAPGGLVDGLLSSVEHGIASWTQDPQIHSFMQQYNIAAGVQEVQNVQANLGIVEIADASATTNPAPSNDQASVEIPAVTNFNAGLRQHAGTGVQVASVDYGNIQIGEAGKGFARDGFNSPASGIVPAQQIEEFSNTMVASVKNDSMQFSIAS